RPTITGWLCACLARLSAEHGSRPWHLSWARGHVLRPHLSFLCFLRSYYLSVCKLFFWFWVVSVAPKYLPPPTTFSSGIRSSKRRSLSFERFCRCAARSPESASFFSFDDLTSALFALSMPCDFNLRLLP